MSTEIVKSWKCFGGTQYVCRHQASATKSEMEFALYIPPHEGKAALPSLTYLSGLTCTWENFTTKSGAQRYAAEHGIALIMPDTSPRGDGVPNDPSYDLGQGAGFYVDATRPPWNANFKMDSYIRDELFPAACAIAALDERRRGICGHSMGGHGALVAALRDAAKYKCVSAIAPIVAPSKVPWGEKAFSAYLGDDRAEWAKYDACELVGGSAWRKPILIDQGAKDGFLDTQLTPELFASACDRAGVPLLLNVRDGYDHSYYFIASVIENHVAFHAEQLAN